MDYMNFLKNRKSVREFRDEDLNLEEIQAIEKAIDLVEESGADNFVRFSLVKNPEGFYKDLDGKAGYAGVMIKAPAYIAIEYKEVDTRNILEGAIFASELVTLLRELELDTCWLTLGENTKEAKEKHFGLVANNIFYAIAVGKAADPRPYSGHQFSTRKAVEEIVFVDHDFEKSAVNQLKDLNMLELFSALKYAPSNKNLQPWRFVLDKGKLSLYLIKGEDIVSTLTDGGIIMYYFQRLVENMGLKNPWLVDIKDLGDKWLVGTYQL